MRRMGASEPDIAKRREAFVEAVEALWAEAVYRDGVWRSRGGELLAWEVLPENAAAWRVFQACESQWEVPGAFGGRCTLPFTALEATLRMLRVPRALWADTFDACRVLISAGRAKLMERKPKR